ncbi:MAG: error-prone DNA polymerase [Rhodanobacter sp.]
MSYAELHCLSNLSFLRGVSTARELFVRATSLGYTALAITDECSLAGIVRALEASRGTGLPLIVGSEITVEEGAKLVLIAQDRAGYANLCQIITIARSRAEKGRYRALLQDFTDRADGLLAILLPANKDGHVHGDADAHAVQLATYFPDCLWIGVELHRGADDAGTLATVTELGQRHNIPLVAAGDVHMHLRRRRALQDAVTAIRLGTTLSDGAGELFPNGERHLRSLEELGEIYPSALLEETAAIARRCTFDLTGMGYQHPHEVVPLGQSPSDWLRYLTFEGAKTRWPGGTPPRLLAQIEHELGLIAELRFEAFFLTVEDIVRFARSRNILCQGRGSAANSVVCYCLGITEVDPVRGHLLFERFLSRERAEPPDIDVDFEHERREEVIQYVYARYGRDRAALAAAITTYRPRSAVRDLGRVLGLGADLIDRIAGAVGGWDSAESMPALLAEAGVDISGPVIRRLLGLATELIGTPRHLSQHVGGFVISAAPLHDLVPLENARMPGRTVCQFDKNDLETLGLLKVDILALGMLSALRRTFGLIARHTGTAMSLADIPPEDPTTYAMLQRADTVGLFQVESRAQMSMLPRLRPTCFYDLVVQTAIIRPGPIQGGMVHPYVRRRQGKEAVTYPSPEIRGVLERTLGVPLFQEQIMSLAVVAAGFTPGEADHLRRSMGAWERHGTLDHFQQRLLTGMAERGYSAAYSAQIWATIRGFGSYGFPESHAASFALLTYASAWLKAHHPAAFLCALFNAQPMGFYTRDQLVQDGRRHRIEIRPPDVRFSEWECHLEGMRFKPLTSDDPASTPVIRLGLREIHGLREDSGKRIVWARSQAPFRDLADLAARAALDQRDLPLLADAGALEGLAGHRHQARWLATGIERTLPLFAESTPEQIPALRHPTAEETMSIDFATLGISTGGHPMSLLRDELAARGVVPLAAAACASHHQRVKCAGMVGMLQRPPSAGGVAFLTLEDETAWLNVVVWPDVADRYRWVLRSGFLAVDGRIERVDGVVHLIAAALAPLAERTGQRRPSCVDSSAMG